MDNDDTLRLIARAARYGIEAKMESLAVRVAPQAKGLLTTDDLSRADLLLNSLPGARLLRKCWLKLKLTHLRCYVL